MRHPSGLLATMVLSVLTVGCADDEGSIPAVPVIVTVIDSHATASSTQLPGSAATPPPSAATSSTLRDYPCAPDRITARGAVNLSGTGISGDAPLPCNSPIEITDGGSANLVWADAGTCTLTQGAGDTTTPASFVSKPSERVLLQSHFGRGDCSLVSAQPVSIESCGFIVRSPGENSLVLTCDGTQLVGTAVNGGEVRGPNDVAVGNLTGQPLTFPRPTFGPDPAPAPGPICETNCPTSAQTTTPGPTFGPNPAPAPGPICETNCPTSTQTTTPGPTFGPNQAPAPDGVFCEDPCPTST